MPRLATVVLVILLLASLLVDRGWSVTVRDAAPVGIGSVPSAPIGPPPGSPGSPVRPPDAPTARHPGVSGSGSTADGLVVEPFATWPGRTAVPPARVATATGGGVTAFDQPADGPGHHWFSSPTEFGGPRVFLVVSERPGWVEVSLPTRPHGRTGWIRTDGVTLSEVSTRAEVSLSDRALRVWDGAELVADTPVVIGAAASPTPVGAFYLRDVIDKADPGGAYGPHILALSAFSEVLDSFHGAEPAIAIHGTDRPELVGQARSNGCIRVPNPVVETLADRLPPGTPVTITA